MTGLRQKVVKGTFWALFERFSSQVISFAVTLVLARLLTPEDYGTVALLSVFMLFAGLLVDSGFGQALIQKKEATELEFNSVFYLSLFIGFLVYAILFASAPFISYFYELPELVPLLRVLAIQLMFNAVNSIQNAELNRKLLFNLSFRISIVSSFVGAVVGIVLALWGFGAWALVWSQLAGGFSGVIVRWIVIAWRPRMMFSITALQGLFGFGWKLLLSALIDVTYSNLYSIIIGKVYTKQDLAFVNKGQHIPRLAMDSINGTLGRVAFPALSQLQDSTDRLRAAMRKMIRVSTFFVVPMMVALAISARQIVLVLLGSQWREAIPYLQIACFSFALWPFHTINLQAISAIGRSDIYLKLELIKKGLGIVIIALTFREGVFVFMAVSAFVCGPLSLLVNAWPNRRLLNYTVFMQLRDALPIVVVSGIMGCVGFGVGFLFDGSESIISLILCVLAQLAAEGIVLIGLSFIFRLAAFEEVLRMVFKKKNEHQMLMRDRRRSDRFLSKISEGKSLSVRLRLSEIYQKWVMYSSPGCLCSYIVEKPYLELAERMDISCRKDVEPNTGLLVMTEAYAWGGHTRWAEKWIEDDKSRRYDLIFTRTQANPVPERLNKGILSRGGIITILTPGSKIQRGVKLREISLKYEMILLDIHPDDALPLVAYGTNRFPRPIVFLNHCNHLFWVGLSIADRVVECAKWQKELSERCRGSKRTQMISFFDPDIQAMHIDKAVARASLGIPVDAKVVLTAGQPYKYHPVGEMDFRKVLRGVLSSDTRIHFYSLGATSELSPDWAAISCEYGGRLHLNGTVSQDEFLKYCCAADAVVDSFPFAGGGVLYNAAQCGCVCVTVSKDFGIADGPFVHCTNQSEVVPTVLKILSDDGYRENFISKLEAWRVSRARRAMNSGIAEFCSSISRERHCLLEFTPKTIDITNNDYVVLATRYNAKYYLKHSIEFELTAFRPYWFGRLVCVMFDGAWMLWRRSRLLIASAIKKCKGR